MLINNLHNEVIDLRKKKNRLRSANIFHFICVELSNNGRLKLKTLALILLLSMNMLVVLIVECDFFL